MPAEVTPNRRLAITLYYVASTCIRANLFGVSTTIVCTCIKDVCEAINEKDGVSDFLSVTECPAKSLFGARATV